MIRFLIRSIVSLICFALLLLAVASVYLWRHSYSHIDVVRVAHPRVGYLDAAFNQGKAQLSFVRRADKAVGPSWLSKPINPTETFFTPNPVLMWDIAAQERKLPAGVLHVKGNAEILPSLDMSQAPPAADPFADTAFEPATASNLRWTHSLVMPGWAPAAALAVLPVLWLLTGLLRRARRRRAAEAEADAPVELSDPDSSRRPHF